MNRRFFLSALSALVASPALPSVAAVPISSQQMITAKIIARAHNRCSVEMLARHLKIPPELAAQVQNTLLRQGVITPPIAGVSMATNPTNTACITNEAVKPTNLLQRAADLKKKLDTFVDRTEGEPSTGQSKAGIAKESDPESEQS